MFAVLKADTKPADAPLVQTTSDKYDFESRVVAPDQPVDKWDFLSVSSLLTLSVRAEWVA